MWDIGCATGRFYRYFQKILPSTEYHGFDISEGAVNHAKQQYPQGEFNVFDGDISKVQQATPDLIFSRDVVQHQPNPTEYLAKLYDSVGKYLILRVWTRETGATVFDVDLSCQFGKDSWVPYIVFNTQELIDLFSSFKYAPTKMQVVRHPVVLGGQSGRYLPKELYYPETGTAETAILIEKGRQEGESNPQVVIETRPEVRGQELSGFSRLIRKISSR